MPAQGSVADLKQLKRQLERPAGLEHTGTAPRQLEAATQFFKAVAREETAHLPPYKLSTRYTRLVGRSKEIGQIKNCLRQPEVRLLTLTGVGGTEDDAGAGGRGGYGGGIPMVSSSSSSLRSPA
jgi:hypothetical protein